MRDWWASPDEVGILLNLSNVYGIGHVKLRLLIGGNNKPSHILKLPINELTKFTGISQKVATQIHKATFDDYGAKQLEQAEKHNASIVNFWDPAYPDKLKKITDPPIFLFVKGQTAVLNSFSLAVVGTRSPTVYGKNITINISRELVESGITIVSGLARGIDTIAHTETLKLNGITIAVLGSGLDMLYPPENRKLATEIAKNGAIISEFPFGTKPDAINFPRRNRIISGLSAGTVVTEAGQRSGALITAYQALEQNREVFAIPGSIFSQKHVGSNKLIKEGAKLVANVEDILEELPAQGDLFSAAKGTNIAEDLTADEKEILAVLRSGEQHIDHLGEILQKKTPLLLSTLLKLELNGFVLQQPGKIFVLNKRI